MYDDRVWENEVLFDEVYGRVCDASPFYRWARTEGRTWVLELTTALLVADFDPLSEAFLDEYLAIARKHGFDPSAQGPFKDAWWHPVSRFARTRFLALARPRGDAGPVSEEMASLAVGEAEEPDGGPIADARKRVTARFGSPLGSIREEPWARLTGDLASSPSTTDTLTMPGIVVESTGEQIAPNRVRWRSGRKEAWSARGLTLAATSLEPSVSAQRAMGVKITTHEDLVRWRDLYNALGEEDAARVVQSVKQRSRRPLLEWWRSPACARVPEVGAVLGFLKWKPGPR
ncbi:MAG: hypothetical protein HY904_24040 [Deltaproteobacteria bacterium]|nr:hypothetical protein [Deltaproteobacteria bacterium]